MDHLLTDFMHAVEETMRRIDRKVCEIFRAEIVETGPLVEAVKQLSHQAGIHPPTVFVSGSKLPNAAAIPKMVDKHRLLITNPLFDAMGCKSIHDITPEIKAVIGHEISHLKDGFGYIYGVRKLPLIGIPIAMVLGRRMFNGAVEAGAANPNDIQAYCQGQNNNDVFQRFPSDPSLEQQRSVVNQLACDIAAGAVGFGVGSVATRQLILDAEYRADRTAAKLVSPRAMINFFHKMEDYMDGMRGKITRRELMGDPFFHQRSEGFFEQLRGEYNRYVIHAHPTSEQRIGALEAMERGVEGAAKPATAVLGRTAELLEKFLLGAVEKLPMIRL